ncbi:MAG: hypothetical protein V4693_10475 [Pseudomonadota bacterium]
MSALVPVDNPTTHTTQNSDGTFTWVKVMEDGTTASGPQYLPEALPVAPEFGMAGIGGSTVPDPWEPSGGFGFDTRENLGGFKDVSPVESWENSGGFSDFPQVKLIGIEVTEWDWFF